MEFKIALSTVLTTLLFIAPGYALSKTKKALGDHLSTLSAILIYVLGPCMQVSSFVKLDFSLEDFKWMGFFFLVSFLLQAAFCAILYLIFRKKHEDARYRIMNIAMVLGNVGFFGLPIVKALLPDNPEVMCYSSIQVITMNILVFTMGIYCLTRDKKYMTVKAAFVNPAAFAFLVAIPLYVTGAKNYIPSFVLDAVDLLGKMTTPVCMLIVGIRLATVPFKKLWTNPAVYASCFGKMVVFPLFCYACVYFLPLPYSFKASILILAATPCASIILNLAEIHHSEMELSANCILVSTLLSFITLPLISLLL